MNDYGKPPVYLGQYPISLPEVMYYLYLPVQMNELGLGGTANLRLPPNLECCRGMISRATVFAQRRFPYIYLSARKGWATPDNPLNRPGWHADGFGSEDLNFVWWTGPGTRFAVQEFVGISDDHIESLRQFDAQIDPERIVTYPEKGLYALDARMIHATPLIELPGCMRQYIKISLSDHRYNLENNSHNYLFDYDWPLTKREVLRNDTHKAQSDHDDVYAP
jgi:hypothetical protein